MEGKIIFLAGLLSQPRCIKRVTSLCNYGFNCIVYGYKRGNYDVNNYPKNIAVNNLGVLKNKDYGRKLIKIWKDVSEVCDTQKNEVFYAFGLLFSLILMIKKKKYIYEISDVLYAYPRFKIAMPIIKWLDKKIILKSELTIMTSGGFYDFFNIHNDKILIIPNKVSENLRRNIHVLSLNPHNGIKFGFVGAVRYETIFRFAEVIGRFFPQHCFHFYGGMSDANEKLVKSLVNQYRNIFSHGVFKSPDDLNNIYNSVDVIVACYDVKSLNEQIAEPNKLYESLFFAKPIIVSQNTYLEKRVKDMKCGYAIDASSVISICSFIESIDIAELNKISLFESQTNESEIVNDQVRTI